MRCSKQACAFSLCRPSRLTAVSNWTHSLGLSVTPQVLLAETETKTKRHMVSIAEVLLSLAQAAVSSP